MQLIQLTVNKRTPVPGNEKILDTPTIYGFDVEDIVSPIRRNVADTFSYFTARQIKGAVNGKSENVGRADYEVDEVLTAIDGQSILLANLSVLFRTAREVDMGGENMIFVRSRISENLKPWIDPNTGSVGGTEFYYHEDGETDVVKYIVSDLVGDIISSGSGGGGGGGPITEINYDLNSGTDMDLTGYSGELIVNVSNGGGSTGTLNTISNATSVTKITIRPISSLTLTVNDGNGATNPKLYAPALTLFGLYHGFLELTRRAGKFYQTNYIDQYNP